MKRKICIYNEEKRNLKVDFLIFYEHFNREIENVLLIKEQLQNMGYSVEVCHFSRNGYGKNILFSRPKVVVTPWLRDNENVFRFIRFKNNPKLVNLQWEQIYCNNDLENGITTTTGLAKKAKHICWGRASKDRLISEGISQKNLKVTGGIQLDFCRKEFIEYYFDRATIAEQYNLDVNKKWVLFISSFTYASYDESTLAILSDKWKDFSEFINISKESRVEVLEWFKELLKSNSDIEFIYRPHPSENIDSILKEMSELYPSFRIINEYSVKQWIKVSDKITTWYSTSVAEIYSMEKPFSILRPIPIPEKFEVAIMREAEFLTRSKELIEKIRDDNSLNFPINKEIFEYYYDSSEIPAYKRVAEYLVEVLNGPDTDGEFEFSQCEYRKYLKSRKNDIITSLLVDFVMKTKLKLSKFIPYRKDVLKNIELYVDTFPDYKINQIQENIRRVFQNK
jgi:surface carbohydrate biosynthesis protein